LALRGGLPFQHGGLAAVPGLDHGAVGGRERNALPGFQRMVLGIGGPGEPHAAAHHGQFAVSRVDAHGLAGAHLKGSAMKQLELRVHHQSPVADGTMIYHLTPKFQ
jgi:hypothetical protein